MLSSLSDFISWRLSVASKIFFGLVLSFSDAYMRVTTPVVQLCLIKVIMNCLFWNCREANKPNFRRSIRYLLKMFDTEVLALFETHAGGDRAGRICQRLGFDNSFRVDVIGQSGGLWLLWQPTVGLVEIVESSDQFIHARVGTRDDCLNLVVVYAAPTVSKRSGLWGKLREVVGGIVEPLLIGGDFNTILQLDERTGGNGRLSPDSMAFSAWINDHLATGSDGEHFRDQKIGLCTV